MTQDVHAVIIEDEVPAARLLSMMLKKVRPEWQITVLPGSIEEAVQWFSVNQHPDIIFLDIQLSDAVSFVFIEQATPSSVIIFTTAYDEYAIRAFNVNSIDYLLKPIDEKRLKEAVIKYETLTGNQKKLPEDYIEHLLESMQNKGKNYRTRFLVSGAERFKPLQVEDIAYFYSENKVTFAVTYTNREYIIDLSLNKLCDQLDPDIFFRANRQMVISIHSVEHFEPYFHGKLSVTLKPSFRSLVTISEEKVSLFKRWLNY